MDISNCVHLFSPLQGPGGQPCTCLCVHASVFAWQECLQGGAEFRACVHYVTWYSKPPSQRLLFQAPATCLRTHPPLSQHRMLPASFLLLPKWPMKWRLAVVCICIFWRLMMLNIFSCVYQPLSFFFCETPFQRTWEIPVYGKWEPSAVWKSRDFVIASSFLMLCFFFKKIFLFILERKGEGQR